MFAPDIYPEMITERAHEQLRELERTRLAAEARAHRRAQQTGAWRRLVSRLAG